jgi:hypothetical protein
MMQRLMSLPLALRVLVIALVLGALVILAAGIPALISSTSERVSGFVQGVEGQQLDAKEVTVDSAEATVSPETEAYLSKVKDTNVGAVEAFLEIDEKLRKFDSLTPEDVEDIEADRNEVADNLDQIEELDPPAEYQEQYEHFHSAIVDLDEAAGLAHSMASDPDSITPAMPERYDLLLDRADFRLQQSDAILESAPETTSSQESD